MEILGIAETEMGSSLECQRCLVDEARFHVLSEVIEMKVCEACAEIARELEKVAQLVPRLPLRLPTWRQARRKSNSLKAA